MVNKKGSAGFSLSRFVLARNKIYRLKRVLQNRLLRGEDQERVAGCAGAKDVAGADKEHAAGDGRAGSGHGAAFGRDMVHSFVITNHVVFPE